MKEVQKNAVLSTMIEQIEKRRGHILNANKKDIETFASNDKALYDRLIVDDKKIDGMITALRDIIAKEDPVNRTLFSYDHPNGMKVLNKTAPFGTIMIIYESRPDVTIEAASIAFKAGSKILLKGGKEAINSNLELVNCWKEALKENDASEDWIQYLDYNREKTQQFLIDAKDNIDLIIPRGGEKLIAFVKHHASCPVIISGRGNNFLYIHEDADWEMAKTILLNAKTAKISACNALDKVLIHPKVLSEKRFVDDLRHSLKTSNVEIISNIPEMNGKPWSNDDIMYEEFLDYKILVDSIPDLNTAIDTINKYSGGHSASIVTRDIEAAEQFMDLVDSAAVYHNASTRFTDGGQLGLGAELAISTDKLHERGPLGLEHLVTNKWYVHGSGQTR